MKTKPQFSIAQLERLKKEGRIQGYQYHQIKEQTPAGKIVSKHFKKRSKEKDYIAKNLFFWCQERALKLFEEYRFDSTGEKGFLFDWAIEEKKIGLEYEGIFSAKSGHTTITGYTKDVRKYNLALSQGWRVIRLTAVDYETLIDQLNNLLKLDNDGPRNVDRKNTDGQA